MSPTRRIKLPPIEFGEYRYEDSFASKPGWTKRGIRRAIRRAHGPFAIGMRMAIHIQPSKRQHQSWEDAIDAAMEAFQKFAQAVKEAAEKMKAFSVGGVGDQS